ncbi:MAG TPA: hypothetical protein VK766_07640 [Cytophagaceae bacterium]|jgi:hypothetical protein|nr:hypothetical protein [Cytophagaceae bacterium]
MKLIFTKLLILFLILFYFSSCGNTNTCEIGNIEDSSFTLIRNYLIKNNFHGTVVLKDYGFEVFHSDKKVSIPLKEIDLLRRLKIIGVVNQKYFSYFIQDGWKGTSIGLLYAEQKNLSKNGFEDIKFLKKSNFGGYWYCVRSKNY